MDKEELLRVRDRMESRGPDGSGIWFSSDDRVGLGHRRLAIIDLSDAGAQPMKSRDGNLSIVFNGEIYNYRELRGALERKGHSFRSSSDTEVLLHLYAEKGEDMVGELRGMFTFAIWDAHRKGMFLARDPFGIKPLYIADDGKTLRAASQVKALLAGGAVRTTPEPAGHVGFFLWGHVPEPYTLYKGIRAFPAGSSLWIGADGCRRARVFCSIRDELAAASGIPSKMGKEEISGVLRSALLDSVRCHLIADVPVGVFLSSGLDSTTLTALASEVAPGTLHSVTLGFHEYRGTGNDEVPLAELVSRHFGTTHRTLWVGKKDFQKQLPAVMSAMDQPTTDGVNSYFVSWAAAQAGLKVAISGLGGDELFGSYPSFGQLPRMVRTIGPFNRIPGLGKLFRLLSAPLVKRFSSPKYAGLLEYGGSYGGAYLLRRGLFMPWELPDLLDGDMVQEGWRELHPTFFLEGTVAGIENDSRKVSSLEMCWYMRNQLLRDTDWASMAHSLEIRLPLVDVTLLRTLAPLLGGPASPRKQDLARTPKTPLPDIVIDKEKTGFSVPVREWIHEGEVGTAYRGLRGWANSVYRNFEASSVRGTGRGIRLPSRSKRILVLLTDAFGGNGGIALYNRDLLKALCSHPEVAEVVAIPRLMGKSSEPLPDRMRYVTNGIGSKARYLATVIRTVMASPGFDLIICGHINLVSLACLVRRRIKAPVLLEIFGIDAWQPTRSGIVNRLVRTMDGVVSISEVTRRRFLDWASVDANKTFLLPNAIHLDLYGAGPKNPELVRRYQLENKVVLMTLGRLAPEERYKGVDEVMDLLPAISVQIPGIAYLIVGDGTDRKRLKEKAASMGVADRVVFAGYISESEKADHYRLADAYVMPSQGEGFGFVFLEAMACGIPVVASTVDGSREAVRNGMLGDMVEPSDPAAIKAAILRALKNSSKAVPEGLEFFSFRNFTLRVHNVVDRMLNPGDFQPDSVAPDPIPRGRTLNGTMGTRYQ